MSESRTSNGPSAARSVTGSAADDVAESSRDPSPAGQPSLARQALMVPNLLSILRLAGVAVFLWLLLGPQEDGWALAILVFAGVSDWLDGKLARWLNQMSSLGQILDPAADRLYIAATLIAFVFRGIVSWWLVAVLLARELLVGVCLLLLRRANFRLPEVTYVGKGATFVLMYAFPLLLLTQSEPVVAAFAGPIGYAFTVWGVALYLWSGALYAVQTVRAIGPHRSTDSRRANGRAADPSS